VGCFMKIPDSKSSKSISVEAKTDDMFHLCLAPNQHPHNTIYLSIWQWSIYLDDNTLFIWVAVVVARGYFCQFCELHLVLLFCGSS
jgi:hypothetical protein